MSKYNENLDYLLVPTDISTDELVMIIDEAEKILNNENSTLDDKAEALLKKAQSLQKLNKFNESKAIIEELLELKPEMPEALVRMGNVFKEEKKYTEAIEIITRGLNNNNEYPYGYYVRALAFYSMNENDKTIADCTKAIELNPDYATAYNNRGSTYYKIDENDKAIDDYTKAIALNPNYATAYNNRGNTYSKVDENDKAIADCTKAIELNPNDADAYINRGNTYSKIDKNDKAIADYTRTIEINPNDAMAYNNRGTTYSKIDENDKAIADYTRTIEINPNYAAAYYNRGTAYDEIDEADKAIADYTKAIEINPNYAAAYFNRGNTYGKKDEADKALADFTKAIEINPNDAEAYYNLSIAHIMKNDFSAAFIDILNYLHYYDSNKENMPEGLNYILSLIIENKGRDFVWELEADVDNIIKVPDYFISLIGLFMKNGLTQKKYRNLFSEVLTLWEECEKVENGKMLFQYTSLPVLQSMFENQNFRLSPSKYLNDPKEGKVLFDYLRENCKEDKELTPYYEKIEDKIKEEESIVFVRCFTSREDDLVMWDSSYGDLGRGVSIAIKAGLINKGIINLNLKNIYNIIEEGKGKKEKNGIPIPFSMLGLFKIKYNKDCIDKIGEHFKSFKKKDFENGELLNLLSKLLLPITTLIKDISREHEDEYRLIYISTKDDIQARSFFKFSTKDGLYMETEKILFEKKYEYKHVCIGPRVDEITYRKCFDAFKNKFGIDIGKSSTSWQ